MSILGDFLDGKSSKKKQSSFRVDVQGPILAVDIGTVYTRAVLINIVEGSYRFVGRGQAPTTDSPPWEDVLIGVTEALNEIVRATGHTLMDESGNLIMPEKAPFNGVSTFVATASAGNPVRAILTGLMPSVSITSGTRIAASSYLQLVDIFSLSDRRSQASQIDAVLEAMPDMVLIVGGTDGGAKESLLKQVETIKLACLLMDYEDRPTVLFAGNRDLRDEVINDLHEDAEMQVLTSENVRPSLEVENLSGVQEEMVKLFNVEKSLNTYGFDDIREWTLEGVLPTAHAFNRVVRILSHLDGQSVLGIDLGSASTTVAASVDGRTYLNVFDEIGSGYAINGAAEQIRPQNIARWLSYDLGSLEDIEDYLQNRWIHPHTIPVSERELELEFAITREIIRSTVAKARKTWQNVRQHGLIPTFDQIVLAGSALTVTPHFGYTALAALDALLPTGMTRILVDPYGIGSALGAVSPFNPQAVVQVLEEGSFIDLGPVIPVTGRARRGETVLRGTLKPLKSGAEQPFSVTYGSIITLPLPPGDEAELVIQPSGAASVNLGGRRRRVTLTGGELGVIIDARGRPWRFPRSLEEHRQMIGGWLEAITQEQPR